MGPWRQCDGVVTIKVGLIDLNLTDNDTGDHLEWAGGQTESV